MERSEKRKPVEVRGTVLETLPNALFKVELDGGYRVVAHIPGKMRARFSRLLPGETIGVEISPYDGSRGRIVCRCGGELSENRRKRRIR